MSVWAWQTTEHVVLSARIAARFTRPTRGFGQGNEELAAKTLLPQFGHQFLGDVPGQQQGIVGLFGKEQGFLADRDQRARHVAADLMRPGDLQHAVEDAVVQARIDDQRAGPRGAPMP